MAQTNGEQWIEKERIHTNEIMECTVVHKDVSIGMFEFQIEVVIMMFEYVPACDMHTKYVNRQRVSVGK